MPETVVRPNLIVVDDTPENLHVLQTALADEGYRVRPFLRGDLALRAAANDPPDLVLVDFLMPGMDGLEVCSALKRDPRLCRIPVVFVSALQDPNERARAFAAGGVDYITKPYLFDELKSKVEMLLRLSRLDHGAAAPLDRRLREAWVATLESLVNLLEQREDPTAATPVGRVRWLVSLLLEAWADVPGGQRFDHEMRYRIAAAAPLHDIGKADLPVELLLSTADLTPAELATLQDHAQLGGDRLAGLAIRHTSCEVLPIAAQVARSHHERWDGTGYPDRLAGEAIPMAARVTAVAEVYEALRCHRTWRSAMSHAAAAQVIVNGSGSQFEPSLVTAFQRIASQVAEHYGG